MMVQYAQQTDPNKAKASSIGEQITPTTQTTTTTPTETKTTTTPVVETKPVAETTLTSTQKRLEKLRPSGTTTTSQPITNNNQAPDWIGDFANNAKLIEKQSQQKALETSKRLATTSANVIATDYNNGGVSAMELQALKESDPLKFQEVSLALEKQNTLNAINQNQEQFMANYKQLTDTYMKAREGMLTDTTGQELRKQIFEQYGLNKSNDMIKNYTTQIDRIDDDIRKLEDYTGTGDAMLDRGKLIRQTRDLSRQRMDAVRARQAEVDYYKLGLEQADAVVSDYKAGQQQRMDLMGKQFEVATGMTTMEFEMSDAGMREQLGNIQLQQVAVGEALTARAERMEETMSNQMLLSLYDQFSDEDRAALSQLPAEQVVKILEKVDKMEQSEYDRGMDQMKFGLDMQKFGLDVEKFGRDKEKYKQDKNGVKHVVNQKDGTTLLINGFGEIIDTISSGAGGPGLSGLMSTLGGRISSYGGDHDGFTGLDIAAKMGTPIPLPFGGEVVDTGTHKLYGNYVQVKDAEGNVHRLSHLQDINVEVGQTLNMNAIVGTVGSTGNSTGPHIDWTIKGTNGKLMSSKQVEQFLSAGGNTDWKTQLSPEQLVQAGQLITKQYGSSMNRSTTPDAIATRNAVYSMFAKGMSYDDISDNIRKSGIDPVLAMNKPFQDAVRNLNLGLSKDKKEEMQYAIEEYINDGDIETAKDYLKVTARTTMKADTQNKVMGAEVLNDAITNIESLLEQYEAKGGSTNIFKGKAENIAKSIGTVTDPELRSIAESIAKTIQSYRQQVSGAAFTESESKEYKAIFPSINNVKELNSALIKALRNSNNTYLDSMYSLTIGQDAYNQVFKQNYQIQSKTPPANFTPRNYDVGDAKGQFDSLFGNNEVLSYFGD